MSNNKYIQQKISCFNTTEKKTFHYNQIKSQNRLKIIEIMKIFITYLLYRTCYRFRKIKKFVDRMLPS